MRLMGFWRGVKRRMRLAVPPLVFLALAGYFAWSATQGDRGLVAYAQREQDLKAAQDLLARNEAERTAWERRVAGLRTSRLDPDALDERARAMLNMADPADVVVLYGPKDKLF
jgi:cell division protein FtsB